MYIHLYCIYTVYTRIYSPCFPDTRISPTIALAGWGIGLARGGLASLTFDRHCAVCRILPEGPATRTHPAVACSGDHGGRGERCRVGGHYYSRSILQVTCRSIDPSSTTENSLGLRVEAFSAAIVPLAPMHRGANEVLAGRHDEWNEWRIIPKQRGQRGDACPANKILRSDTHEHGLRASSRAHRRNGMRFTEVLRNASIGPQAQFWLALSSPVSHPTGTLFLPPPPCIVPYCIISHSGAAFIAIYLRYGSAGKLGIYGQPP